MTDVRETNISFSGESWRLAEEENHRFLAVIGQLSKHGLAGETQEDYIGRSGIGLLSCFMVSESIVVYTQSMEGGPAYVWTGREDGTYTLDELGHAEWFYGQAKSIAKRFDERNGSDYFTKDLSDTKNT